MGAQLAREQDLLDVAPRERGSACRHEGRSHVELADELGRVPFDNRALDPAVPPVRVLTDTLQEQVQSYRKRADDAFAQAVVGHVSEAEFLAAGDLHPRDRAAVEHDVARTRGTLARDHLRERALAVAVDTRDAEDLALPEVERHALDPELRAVARRAHALELEDDLGVRRNHPGHPLDVVELLLQLGEVGDGTRLVAEHDPHDLGPQRLLALRAESRVVDRADKPSLAEDRDLVAERERLVQLVGDEDHGLALLLQMGQDVRQLGDSLRGQHRGWLVENQHARASPERLDDLHLLLMAEREVGRSRVGIDLDAELGRELGETPPRGCPVEAHPPVVAEHEVLEHAQRRDQRRVLVDGADPEHERLPGRGDRRLDALDPDRARIRADQPREDADQGRFAGAVLTEQAVDFAAAERQAHVVVRKHSGERLDDAEQLDDRRSVVVPCVHRARPDFLQRNVPRGAPRTHGDPRTAWVRVAFVPT